MEVVLGFAVGYFVGARQGRRGLQEAIDSAQAIMASGETRQMLTEAISTFGNVAGPVMDRIGRSKSGSSRAALIGSVVDELIDRRSRRAA